MSVGELMTREERPPYVQFERRPVQDMVASQREGRYIANEVDYVLVTPPYSKDCIPHKVKSWFENMDKNVRDGRMNPMWVEQWKKGYEGWKAGQEVPLHGTPIKGWGIVSPAQQQMLISVNCLTVEDLAAMGDEGMRRVGMGALDLKNKAINWLKTLKDSGAVAMQVSALEKENETLKLSIDTLIKQVESLKARLPETPEYVTEEVPTEITAADILDEPTPKKRGRPRKE